MLSGMASMDDKRRLKQRTECVIRMLHAPLLEGREEAAVQELLCSHETLCEDIQREVLQDVQLLQHKFELVADTLTQEVVDDLARSTLALIHVQELDMKTKLDLQSRLRWVKGRWAARALATAAAGQAAAHTAQQTDQAIERAVMTRMLHTAAAAAAVAAAQSPPAFVLAGGGTSSSSPPPHRRYPALPTAQQQQQQQRLLRVTDQLNRDHRFDHLDDGTW